MSEDTDDRDNEAKEACEGSNYKLGIPWDAKYMKTGVYQMYIMCIYVSPHARTLNMVKKIPRQFGPWNPLETPICLNMPLVLKEFLGPFLRKCIF